MADVICLDVVSHDVWQTSCAGVTVAEVNHLPGSFPAAHPVSDAAGGQDYRGQITVVQRPRDLRGFILTAETFKQGSRPCSSHLQWLLVAPTGNTDKPFSYSVNHCFKWSFEFSTLLSMFLSWSSSTWRSWMSTVVVSMDVNTCMRGRELPNYEENNSKVPMLPTHRSALSAAGLQSQIKLK